MTPPTKDASDEIKLEFFVGLFHGVSLSQVVTTSVNQSLFPLGHHVQELIARFLKANESPAAATVLSRVLRSPLLNNEDHSAFVDREVNHTARSLAAEWVNRILDAMELPRSGGSVSAVPTLTLDSYTLQPLRPETVPEADWQQWRNHQQAFLRNTFDDLAIPIEAADDLYREFAIRVRFHLAKHGDLWMPDGLGIHMEDGAVLVAPEEASVLQTAWA